MNRKPVQEWMLLFTYIFVLILVTIHSGFLCRKFFFILKQFMPVAAAGVLAFVLNHPYKFVESLYEKRLKFSKRIARIGALLTIYLGLIGMIGVLGRIALPRFISGLQNFIEKRDSYIASFEASAVAGTAFGLFAVAGVEAASAGFLAGSYPLAVTESTESLLGAILESIYSLPARSISSRDSLFNSSIVSSKDIIPPSTLSKVYHKEAK